MVTAERDAEAVRAALHGGALQYLVKPFEYADFAARLQRVRELHDTLSAGSPDQAAILALNANQNQNQMPRRCYLIDL